MKHVTCLIGLLSLGLALQPLQAVAQQQEPATDAQTTPETKRLEIPAPLSGLLPQLTPAPESKAGALLVGGLDVTSHYDTSAVGPTNNREGDGQLAIVPTLGLQGFVPDTEWILKYSGGMTYDQKISENDQITHGAIADVRHQFNKHLSTEMRGDYVITNNPFTMIGTSDTGSVPGGPGTITSFVFVPMGTRIASATYANLDYQFSRTSAMGMSGGYSTQRFRDVVTTTTINGSLIDTRAIAGRGFYVKQISRYQTIGAEYQLQDLTFGAGLARTVDHTLYLFDGIALNPETTLTLFAGPEASHLHNVLILNPDLSTTVLPFIGNEWSVAGGLMFTWQGRKSGIRASGQRSLSDGGGYLGSVRLNTGKMEWRTRLTERWDTLVELTYSDGKSLAGLANGTEDRVTVAEGLIGIERKLRRDLSIKVRYAHVYQPHGGPLSLSLLGHHNLVEVGMIYQFQRIVRQ